MEIRPLVESDGTNVGVIFDGEAEALASDELVTREVRELGFQLTKWINDKRTVTNRSNLFQRGAYTPPDNIYAEMLAAHAAVDSDDVVGSVAELTEALAFKGVKFEAEDPDETDVFNQIARDLDLDGYCRKVWREEFAASQCVTASWWGYKTFTVRGKTSKGVKRKKTMTVFCPQVLTVLDGMKIVPVGSRLTGEDRLAWAATEHEMNVWTEDPLMQRYVIGQYTPAKNEYATLEAMGVDPDSLLELNPLYVWRHTVTRPDYKPFAAVRLRSIFRSLDLKQQLMESDRVSLIGAANYILLVKKGSKEQPATTEEIANLKDNFKVVAKLPVIIGDHRLNIEIITPDLDLTLVKEKYDTLNTQIALRSLGTFHIPDSGRQDSPGLSPARAVAAGMENRRRMIGRSIEQKIARAIVNHPANDGLFSDEPNFVYVPKQIALDMDQVVGTAVQAMRNTGDLSRMSYLEHFGFDEFVEAQRRRMEKDQGLDDVFQTHVPFDSPANGGNPGQADQQPAPDGGGGNNLANEAKKKPDKGATK